MKCILHDGGLSSYVRDEGLYSAQWKSGWSVHCYRHSEECICPRAPGMNGSVVLLFPSSRMLSRLFPVDCCLWGRARAMLLSCPRVYTTEVSPCLRRERVRPFAQPISDLRHLSLLLVHEAERTSLAMWLWDTDQREVKVILINNSEVVNIWIWRPSME
jgi:hypothetical protein